MRLFHVSENSEIKTFLPRILERRNDLDQGEGFVWAVNGERLYNLLFPTYCPRLSTFRTKEGPNYSFDITQEVLVVIETKWLEAVKECALTIYEFNPATFVLQNENAGYYVSPREEKPIAVYHIESCLEALEAFDIKVKTEENLWETRDAIFKETKQFSFCKMPYAQPPNE